MEQNMTFGQVGNTKKKKLDKKAFNLKKTNTEASALKSCILSIYKNKIEFF